MALATFLTACKLKIANAELSGTITTFRLSVALYFATDNKLVLEISGLLSKNCDENPRKIFNSKLLPKVRACVDSRCDFWTTDLNCSANNRYLKLVAH